MNSPTSPSRPCSTVRDQERRGHRSCRKSPCIAHNGFPFTKGGHLWELTAGSERMLLLCGLEDDHAIYRDIHRETIATEPNQYGPGLCIPAEDLRPSESNQTIVDIPTAYRIVKITAVSCQNIDRFASRRRVPRRRWFRKVADPTSESAGRPEEAPTDSSPRGSCLGTFCSLQRLAPTPLWPQPRSRRQGTRRRAAAEQGTRQTWDSRRQGETGRESCVGGSRGPDPRERVSSSGACSVPGAAASPPLRSCGSDLPAEKPFWQAGRRRRARRASSARGWPRGAGLTRAVEAAVGIPGWQLVKRYCGEIGSQGLRDDLDTDIPRVAHRLSGVGRRDRLVRRRPCQQVIQQQEE